MVTPLEEKNRKKCHKYWPEEDEQMIIYGQFKINLVKQSDSSAIIERTFKLTQINDSKVVLILMRL